MYDFITVYPSGNPGSEKWAAALADGLKDGAVPLTVADMEFAVAPEITEAIRAQCESPRWGYTFADDAFKAVVCGWMDTRHGWQAQPAWMVNTYGIVPALYVAVRALTQPGDGVIVQPPVYPPFFSATTQNGRKIVENRLKIENGRYQIDFEDLERCAKQAKLMLFCSPHNPGGRVWTPAEVERVAQICQANGVVLFSDEIHCDLLMKGVTHYSAGRLAGPLLQNTLIATSATKSFNIAGLPCSTIFVPDEEKRKAMEGQKAVDGNEFNSILGLAATRAAYEKGAPWLDELLAVVEDNHRFLRDALAARIPKAVVLPMEATYLAWIDFSAFDMEADALTRFLRDEAQLYLNPGEMFGAGGEGHARLNLACPKAVLEAAVDRLEAACKAKGLA